MALAQSRTCLHGRVDRPLRVSLAADAFTVVAATIPAESLVFIGVHVKYHETAPIIMCTVLGLLMAFIAYGRMVLSPIP
ncbi:MAG: hypothetical protein U0V87_12295 [Acidobacteriota bacterium]